MFGPFPAREASGRSLRKEVREPLWARNGKQLFYRSTDGSQVWVVDVRTDGGFSASKPRLLFKAPGFGVGDPIRAGTCPSTVSGF